MNNVFNVSDIKTYEPKYLNGKTLKMIVTESEGITLIAGQDVETKVIYVLSQNHE